MRPVCAPKATNVIDVSKQTSARTVAITEQRSHTCSIKRCPSPFFSVFLSVSSEALAQIKRRWYPLKSPRRLWSVDCELDDPSLRTVIKGLV